MRTRHGATAEITAEVDEDGCLETSVTVKRPTSEPAPVKRRTRHQAPILHGLFDKFGGWPKDPAKRCQANTEYFYTRSALGICRACPNKLNLYKHRCDACQAKERERFRAAKYQSPARPRRSKIKQRKVSWAERVRRSVRGRLRQLKRRTSTSTLVEDTGSTKETA